MMDWMSHHKGNKRWPQVDAGVGALGMTAAKNPIIFGLGAYSASKWFKKSKGSKNKSYFTPPVSPAMNPVMAPQSLTPFAMQSPTPRGYDQQYAFQGGYAPGITPQNYNGSMGMPPLNLNGGSMPPLSLTGAVYTPSQTAYPQGSGGYVPVQGSNGHAYAKAGNSYGSYGSYSWK